ncbi:MAG: glycosyltransferase, partial [Acidobacteria bacterium]|nr:glycosyltransferase [Acidobacteriota bacterium]
GAQNCALEHVRTPWVMAIDADTVLAPDAIEKLAEAFEDPEVAAACGLVLPRHVRTVWERGRYIEYLFAFTFYKQVQDYYDKPLISSGCFSMYRSDVLQSCGGWPTRTLAEDMDLTWTFFANGYRVRFVPEAVCYPIEPHNFDFMCRQLRRWSHGFVQNLKLHWQDVLHVPFLRSAVAVSLWDATIASLVYLFLLPLLLILFRTPWPLLGYAIDMPAILVPVLAGAAPRREIRKALVSFPSFLVLRMVNAVFFLRAMWSELVVGHSFRVYEKGH